MAPEADQYLAEVGRRFATGGGSQETLNDLPRELALRDAAAAGDCLTGELSAVDLTVYPFIALLLRVAARGADFDKKTPPHRAAPRPLDRSHADASHRSTDLAAALEPHRSDLTGRAALRDGE